MVRLACSPIPRSGGDDVNGSRLPLGRQTRRRVQLKDAVAESGIPSQLCCWANHDGFNLLRVDVGLACRQQ